MRQLSALDTQFLTIESATTLGHVGSVVVVTPPDPSWGLPDVRALLADRLHLAPVLRERLVTAPLGVARPWWVQDPDFDLDAHLHTSALPGPGTDEQLGAEVARLHERAIDRTRAPWECHVLTGLAGGRVAVYSKVHHAAIDGVSGAALLSALFDVRPEPRAVETAAPFAPRPLPSSVERLGRGVSSLASDSVRLARTAPPSLARLGSVTGGLRAPRTPLNGPISAERAFAFGSVPLPTIKALRAEHGGTPNDVVVALCAAVVRRWLVSRDALPDAPLVAVLPVSVRRRERKDAQGNELSAMLTELPTHVADPRERAVAARLAMDAAKERFDAVPHSLTRDLAGLLPTSGAVARPLYAVAGRLGLPINLMISNVPGPRVPLWLAGARVDGVHPVSAVTGFTGALNITVYTHGAGVDFGFVACRERVPDVWELARFLDEAVTELTAS